MLKAAVIGAGNMGRNHARIYADIETAQLSAVVDPNAEAVEAVAKRLGIVAYNDAATMLTEQAPDAVSIAVPTAYHLSVGMLAASRGCHVLVEKPIASTLADGQQLIETAKQTGITLMVGHVERFNPAVQELKQRISDGQIGKIFKLQARRKGPYPRRDLGTGVALDLAVHDLDIMTYVSGAKILQAHSSLQHCAGKPHEDSLVSTLQLENDIVGTLDIDWITPTKIRELIVTGEKGMFIADLLRQDLTFYENNAVIDPEALGGVIPGDQTTYSIANKEPLREEILAFIKAIEEGGEAPVSGEDALEALRLAQMVLTNTNVKMP